MRLKNNQQGLTLIEVLAATAIGAIVLLLIGSALTFGLTQYQKQLIKTRELTDVTYLAKMVTKDIRRAGKVEMENGSLRLEIGSETVTYSFDSEKQTVLKNGQEILKEVILFEVEKGGKEDKFIHLKIESNDSTGMSEKIDTNLYIR